MSAKWRRSKRNLKKSSIFKAIGRVKTGKTSETSCAKAPRSKRQTHTYRCSVQRASREKRLREPKPLIDVLEDNHDITVVTEFVGFKKEDLRINVKDRRLVLSAEASDRKYRKSLNLPKRVVPSTLCTTYKNGVLEIRLKKVIEEGPMDRVAG